MKVVNTNQPKEAEVVKQPAYDREEIRKFMLAKKKRDKDEGSLTEEHLYADGYEEQLPPAESLGGFLSGQIAGGSTQRPSVDLGEEQRWLADARPRLVTKNKGDLRGEGEGYDRGKKNNERVRNSN